ncbi:MAG: flagellar basal body P-ring protein FlgI [Candidatus Gastranaerophilales bacterium]|nr:flagellar basal body P-ring protein FlgI [Candidatus Gastranaerophilales bacterium]
MLKKLITSILILMLLSPGLLLTADASTVRVKDIAHVSGIRDNQVVGYGLVTGLASTGDNSRSTQITNQNLLNNLGTTISNFNDIKKGNSAAVIVTATIPPFAKNGDRIDVIVSSMADAKSLEGGVLIQTQLLAPNGEIVAVAQGPISVGGTDQSAGGSRVRTSITTSGRIPGGAIIERDIHTIIGDETGIKLVLNKPDYTMVTRVTQAINSNVANARALDGNTVQIEVPVNFQNNRVGFLSMIENLVVTMNDNPAKIIVNERTGTVVIGNEVKLLPAAIAHGNLTVNIRTDYQISQPLPFAPQGAQTTVVGTSEIEVTKESGKIIELPSNSNLNELVRALNAIGVTPIDLISILQALKAAGSLQATIEII